MLLICMNADQSDLTAPFWDSGNTLASVCKTILLVQF